jgi:AcrR family transcriptional regulator
VQVPRTDKQPRRRLAPEERREAILSAAERTFAEHVYDQVALAAVASSAGASEALVYRYFEGKVGLYTEVVRLAVQDLADSQQRALDELSSEAPARDQVRACTVAYLDHVKDNPAGVRAVHRPPAAEPSAAAVIRREARQATIARIAGLLLPDQGERHAFAIDGYLGFLEATCDRWVAHGCPENQRWPLIDAALGALEGALGDWGR